MQQIMSAFNTLCKTKEDVFSYARIKQDDKENVESIASSSKRLVDDSKRGTKRKAPPSDDKSKPKKQHVSLGCAHCVASL